MTIIQSILSPAFLVDNIPLISFVLSVMLLVIFDDVVFGKIVFPLVDFLRFKTGKAIGVAGKRKYLSEALATVLVILYCYIGYEILGVYVIEPILRRWAGIILIVVVILFLILNYLVNNPRMRKKYFGFGTSRAEAKA